MDGEKAKYTASAAFIKTQRSGRTNIKDLLEKAKLKEKKEKRNTLVVAGAAVSAVAAAVLIASL
tara:strand:- start:1099 stop:1290 length:192 start_codon:yes stop_codon:yes gene_type:complete